MIFFIEGINKSNAVHKDSTSIFCYYYYFLLFFIIPFKNSQYHGKITKRIKNNKAGKRLINYMVGFFFFLFFFFSSPLLFPFLSSFPTFDWLK
jgi:hypothetical protein